MVILVAIAAIFPPVFLIVGIMDREEEYQKRREKEQKEWEDHIAREKRIAKFKTDHPDSDFLIFNK